MKLLLRKKKLSCLKQIFSGSLERNGGRETGWKKKREDGLRVRYRDHWVSLGGGEDAGGKGEVKYMEVKYISQWHSAVKVSP